MRNMDSSLRSVKPVRSIKDKIRSIFEKAQEQFRHQTLLEKCKALYKKCDDSSFLEEFKTALRYALAYPDKEAVDNILLFVSKFVILLYTIGANNCDMDGSDTISEECTFPNSILELLFKTHGASLTQVRLRCLQLMNKILSGMPENSTISDSVWVKLTETVLTRIQDKSSSVRVQAVLTARKLQDPTNAECEIIKAFVFHLNDPNSAVRRTVVSSIAFNKITIGHVLARTRDVNDNVRRNTYIVFSKVRFLNLTIKYRMTILERGLQDRSAIVKNCVLSILLVNWLENFNKDVVKFIECLDVVNCPDSVLRIVENIFKVQPIEEILKSLPLDHDTRLIPVEKLTPELALLWRAVAHHFWNEKNEEELEKVLPNITVFCNYIRIVYPLDKDRSPNMSHDEKWEEVKKSEILKHLLEMIKVLDYTDEFGRLKLKKLIFDMLSSPRVENDKVECLFRVTSSVIHCDEMFLQELTEIISDVIEPLVVETVNLPKHKQLEMEMNICDLKLTLNDLREKEYDFVRSKNYSQAEILKVEIEKIEAELKSMMEKTTSVPHEVREKKNDPETVCKCLTIITHMIKYSQVQTLTPTLRNIKENFLNQYFTSEDVLTQNLSIQILGQLCVLDLDLAKENLFRFIIMLSETGEDEINGPALKSIFDILLYHGVKPFENLHKCEGDDEIQVIPPDEEDLFSSDVEDISQRTKFIPILVELLNCKSNDLLKLVAFEGLCKLLLSGVIYSPNILEKIVLKGFSPIIDNESEDNIHQVFMVFFRAFASQTPRSQEMIQSAFIPTIRRITTTGVGTPEADINPRTVASFLIEHTRPDINKQALKALHVHENLALAICHEILREAEEEEDQDSEVFSCYLKSLLQLEISLDNEHFANQIRVLTDRIKKKLNDRILIRHLNEFKKRLEDKAHHHTLTSIENTLTTTRESAETVTDESVMTTERNHTVQTTEKNSENRGDLSDDSSSDNGFLLSSIRGRKTGNFVPESPEISE